MSKQFDEEYEEARQWTSLIEHEYFGKLLDKIQMEKDRITKDIEKLSETPSLSNSVEMMGYQIAKNKLNELIKFFDFMKDKKSLLDKRNVERKTHFPFSITK